MLVGLVSFVVKQLFLKIFLLKMLVKEFYQIFLTKASSVILARLWNVTLCETMSQMW